MFRAVLFQIHVWVGIGVGLYIFMIGITGAALVFRQDMQAAAYPEFFHVDRRDGEPLDGARGRPDAELSVVLRELQAAYPAYRPSGLDWPTYRRATFLAYVSRADEFKTVFLHPVTGRVTGELPFDWIRWLQELHFNLLSGPTGLVVNGIGSALLLVMCLTGVVIVWPWIPRWTFVGARRRRAPTAHRHNGWRRLTWEVHGAIGVWAWALLVMWALTGMYFAFPPPFRNLVNAVSPLTVVRAPESGPPRAAAGDPARGAGGGTAPGPPAPQPAALLARALEAAPGARPARFVLPFGERGTFLVVLARAIHGDYDTSDELTFYFDQYSGDLLLARDHGRRGAGDVVLAWIGPLHVGGFGGVPVKILWALFGLALPLLFVLGMIMWWTRGT